MRQGEEEDLRREGNVRSMVIEVCKKAVESRRWGY